MFNSKTVRVILALIVVTITMIMRITNKSNSHNIEFPSLQLLDAHLEAPAHGPRVLLAHEVHLATPGRGDGRQPRCHGLDQGQAPALAVARQHEGIHRFVPQDVVSQNHSTLVDIGVYIYMCVCVNMIEWMFKRKTKKKKKKKKHTENVKKKLHV